jgi:hypothetical protein
LTSVLLLLSEQFLSLFLAHTFSPRLSALPAERHGGGVLPLILGGRDVVLDLAGRDPHDVDGVADHVGRTAFTFGALGHHFTRLSWS